MKCFYFSKGDRKSESRSRKSIWTPSWSGGSNPEGRRSGSSDITSQTISTISDVSTDSPDPNVLQCSSQRPANNLRVFTYAELRASTRNFSRTLMIGEGGFGCVYKGWVRSLDDQGSKIEVAVKQLNRKGLQGHKEWVTEVHFLGLVEHPNLVKLVGYCAEDDERGIQRLLVYEFMPNKSLEEHLFSRALPVLPWNLRLQIALGAARGLAYLHEEMDFQIIFRDFKTSNILLDEDFSPKLSDFGLARQGPTPGISHVSTAVVGTVGYAAPEYIQTGHLTSKSDVWSFGIVLYELLTGRRSMDKNLPKNEQKLLEWVKPYISDNKRFHLIMDPRLGGQYSLKSAQKVACVANGCLVKHARSRPKMSEVVDLLKQIIETSDAGSGQAFIACPDVERSTEILTQPVKPAVNSKRRMLLLRDIMIFRSRGEKGRPAWRAWAPKIPRTL